MKLEELAAVNDLLKRSFPDEVLLDIFERGGEFIILCRDYNNPYPYAIHHCNSNGIYYDHYYEDAWSAGSDFYVL